MTHINFAKLYTIFPGGRFIKQGPWSGEWFRDQVLHPLLQKGETKIHLELDGTRGYGSSFLEEAFGGLVRNYNYNSKELLSKIILITNDPSLKSEIEEYIEEAIYEEKK